MKLDKCSDLIRRRSLIALAWLSNLLLLLSLTIAMPTVSAVEMIRGLGGDADVGDLAMGRNDDGSSARKMLGTGFPHGINFFGETYDSLYINNNGNVTFNGPVSGFTPVSFPVSSQPMIAPYWGDVDTRSSNVPDPVQNNVYYSTVLANQFIVTWFYVGYYSVGTDKLNAFQLILTDRNDLAPGDFDVEFRYEQLEWTTGSASGGSGGLGGVPAQVGFDAGDRTHFYKHPDSMTAEVLNLINTSNVGEEGVWRFEVRSGIIIPPNNILSDVNVTVTMPVTDLDIELTSFATEPFSIDIGTEQTLVKWHFETFAADQVKDLGFDITLRNPVQGEERVITYVLALSYLDINGNPVYTELGPQSVTVLPSVYQLNIDTDKTSYSVEEPIDITYKISNLSTFAQEADIHFSVQDANGNLVADLGTQSQVTLGAEANLVLSEPDFFTGTLYAGPYQVVMAMLDNTGQTVMSATTAFEIVAPIIDKVAAVMTTDKPVYNPLETVHIQNRIKNTVPNAIVDDLTAITTIYAPDNSVFWSNEKAVPQLLPSQIEDQNHAVPLGQAVPGNYHLTLVIQDAQGLEKAASSTDIEVQSTAETGFGLVGKLSATPTIVLKSEPVSLTGQIENLGNATVQDLPLVLSIIDPEAEEMVTQWTETVPSLIVSGQYEISQDWPVLGDVGKTYVATLGVLKAEGETQILATTSFIIADRIESTFEPGTKGRLLILLDKETAPDNDPHGPKTAPTLSAQRAFLETLLKSQGWSYTIVTDEQAFTRELRSGGYIVYALFSEQQKLKEAIQKELREAVYRGEGLVIAGAHDKRHHFDEVLGIKYKGKYTKASAFILAEDSQTEAVTIPFAFSDHVLRAELKGALSLGTFQLGHNTSCLSDDDDDDDHHSQLRRKKNGDDDDSRSARDDDDSRSARDDDDDSRSDDDDDSRSERDDDDSRSEPHCDKGSQLAMSFHEYGIGKSLYAGFDLLAQATASGENSAFADLLLMALTNVHPEPWQQTIGSVIPLELNLTNQGSALSGQVLIYLPEDTSLIAPLNLTFYELELALIWPFELDANQTAQLAFWLRLPWVENSVSLDTLIQVGTAPNYQDYDHFNFELQVQAHPCLPEALALLTSLKDENKAYAKALKYSQKAADLIQQGKDDKSLKELVKAIDALRQSDAPEAHTLRVMLGNAIRNVGGVIFLTQ
ncbi:MAG: nidogen-like domain-containing protein [Candidatus Parabeggiatoa sp.]|nr:nidogen-like domain-containing protein [Candidatus Parabeggiatoa sp.]